MGPYTCLIGEGLCSPGWDPVWTEIPSDGSRPACCSFSVLDARSLDGDKSVGEATTSIADHSLKLEGRVVGTALLNRVLAEVMGASKTLSNNRARVVPPVFIDKGNSLGIAGHRQALQGAGVDRQS
jgi:hypothetical protein